MSLINYSYDDFSQKECDRCETIVYIEEIRDGTKFGYEYLCERCFNYLLRYGR